MRLRRSRRGLGRALVGVAAGAVLLAGAGSARADKIHSKVTISAFVKPSGAYRFAGKVRSPDPKCEKGRNVRLLEGAALDLPGSDKTNGKGRWRISLDTVDAGDVYAKVGPKDLIGPSRHDKCEPDTFPVVHVFATGSLR